MFEKKQTLKAFLSRRTLAGFSINWVYIPGFSLRLNPGLKLANAFGVYLN